MFRSRSFWHTLLARAVLPIAALLGGMTVLLVLLNFPSDTDAGQHTAVSTETRAFYEEAYAQDGRYVQTAGRAAISARVTQRVREFVQKHRLETARVLEVGAGSGLLQDIVKDYTGLDLSANAARYFHKPFVAASATAMPFADNSFDAVWSIWTLEHLSSPERGLSEMRRVVRNGGYILLFVSWNCPSWAGEGYEVRPYSDFNWQGKLIKASIPIRRSRWYKLLYVPQIRVFRSLAWHLGGAPTRLRFRRLNPGYSWFWTGDSDAAVSIDWHEAVLWFKSRGDVCLNCPGEIASILFSGWRSPWIAVQVRK